MNRKQMVKKCPHKNLYFWRTQQEAVVPKSKAILLKQDRRKLHLKHCPPVFECLSQALWLVSPPECPGGAGAGGNQLSCLLQCWTVVTLRGPCRSLPLEMLLTCLSIALPSIIKPEDSFLCLSLTIYLSTSKMSDHT